MMLLWRSREHSWLALMYVAMLLTETVVKCSKCTIRIPKTQFLCPLLSRARTQHSHLTPHPSLHADILQAVLGLPTECLHHNKIRPCKLSFSCWLQGGKHVQGCGDNRWLFSCCITERDTRTPAATAAISADASGTAAAAASAPVPAAVVYMAAAGHAPALITGVVVRKPPAKHARTKSPHKFGGKYPSKKNVLRRRTDTDGAALLHGNGAAGHPKPPPPLVECGIAKTAANTLQKRIIGGRTAQFAEYPWQAHIRIAEFQCGGVLVARQFIATAAHCIQQARVKDILVYLGELDTQNVGAAVEPLPAEKHRVIKKLVHPRFQFRVTQPDRYDLALLQLATPTAYK